ncbi:MAG: response regulator [Anaerolineales bacterium]|nr:response regulator [Anaerolineales bacterium]
MSKPATILVVEDDQSMLDGISDLLLLIDAAYKVQVLTAENGRLGLDVLAGHTPNLIISDIMMPEMDGYEFLEHVRARPEWVHIPIIFLTAKGSRQDVHRGRMLGADLYITKPFNSTDFLELVQTQLDREAQLRENRQMVMQNMKKDILQILNHEFRTPLTYVTAYYEMLSDGLARMQTGENLYEYLRGIQVGCVRLTRLVEDFIRVIEIRTGEIQTRFQARETVIADVTAVVRRALERLRGLGLDHGVQIQLQTVPDLPAVWGDPLGLQDAIMRLLDNAAKFTHYRQKHAGVVRVSLGTRDQQVTIAVSDEGIGFPGHVREAIFKPFYQYNRGLMEQQGPGIGLTIAQAWVELHQGVIEVDSQEDEGSMFTVCLPIYDVGRARVIPLDRHSENVPATVLLVEDDPHLLIGLQELLLLHEDRYTLRVLTAVNGRVGLDVLAQEQPDLIISDIMMPEMNGYEFLKEVRQNPEWVQIPFIFLTAKGELREIHEGWRSGVEEYITKPYDSNELLDLITTQLDRRFQMQRVFTQDFEALKRGILSLITPDFRLPLSTVAQYSSRLIENLDHIKTDGELKGSLQGIREGSLSLTRLVEDLISLAELQTGESAAAYALRAGQVNDVSLLLYDAGQSHARRAAEKGIGLRFALDHDLPPIFGDAVMLYNSFKRFVEVGIEQSELPAGSEIVLRSGLVRDEVYLTLQLPAALPAPAYRAFADDAEMANTVLFPGIQLVRGVMRLHNGRTNVAETAVGTAITLVFPVYEAVSLTAE